MSPQPSPSGLEPRSTRMSRRAVLKFSGMLALSVGSLGIAACTPAPTPTPAPQATTAAASGATQSSAPAATSADATLQSANLKVWTWWPEPVESFKAMGASFTKQHSGITVTVEAPTDYWTKLQTALAGGAGPDLYFMNNVNYWSWANKNILVDLDPYIQRDSALQKDFENFWQDSITYYKYKGKNFGLPLMYTTVVLYYNEDALKQASLALPATMEDKFNWDMTRDYAQKLTKREGDKVTFWGFSSTEGIETGWLNWVRANGGDFVNTDHTQCTVDQDPSIAAWQYLTDLRIKDQVSPSPSSLQAENTQSMFLTGKIALWPGGSWNMKTFTSQIKDFTYDISIVPLAPQTGKSGGTTNIVGMVLDKGGKAIEQSWALLTHILSKDSQDTLAKSDILAPVRNDSADFYYDPKLGPSNRKAAMRMQQWTTPLPAHDKVTWAEMMKPTTDWQNQIFDGKVGVKEGLTKLAADVNDLFSKGS